MSKAANIGCHCLVYKEKTNSDMREEAMMKRIIFLDGQKKMSDPAEMDRLKPGRLQGQGVFETMRSYQGEIFLLEKHLDRLMQGLRFLKIPAPYSRREIGGHLYEILADNKLKNARVRLVVWQQKRKQHVAIEAVPYKPFSSRKYRKGFKAMIDSTRRRFPSGNIKSIDYKFFLKAYEAATQKGYDEAILRNQRGEVVEGSRANIFFVKKGKLFTPSLQCGCLKGITRDAVLRLAKERGIQHRATAFGREFFVEAEEAFLTNSLLEIMPLTSVNGQKIGNGRVGPVTVKLTKVYKKFILSSLNS